MFGSKHRTEKKAAEEAAKKAHDEALLRQAVVNLIALAEGQDSTDPDWPLMLRHGERLVSTVQGCGLFEPRRGAGHWQGRSAGVSIPVPDTRLRVRLGKSAGTFVQGAETPTVIDTGNASLTTQRVVFQGDKYTREWEFSKLVGVIHYADKPATAIQVSNRQKTSGIVYPGPSPEPLRLAMTVAIAIFQGEVEETITELRAELAKLDAVAPPGPGGSGAAPAASASRQEANAPPTTSIEGQDQNTTALPDVTQGEPSEQSDSSPLLPPSWAADPTGRHQWRYWDGKTWTDYVGDNGQQSRDPVGSHPA
jgi:hypothetical protein